MSCLLSKLPTLFTTSQYQKQRADLEEKYYDARQDFQDFITSQYQKQRAGLGEQYYDANQERSIRDQIQKLDRKMYERNVVGANLMTVCTVISVVATLFTGTLPLLFAAAGFAMARQGFVNLIRNQLSHMIRKDKDVFVKALGRDDQVERTFFFSLMSRADISTTMVDPAREYFGGSKDWKPVRCSLLSHVVWFNRP